MTQPHTPQPEDSHTRSKSSLGELLVKALDLVSRLVKAEISAVRAEMKRVTWPTKQDVLRWSLVVVGALLFFGITVAVLDNLIITPVLVGISGLGA